MAANAASTDSFSADLPMKVDISDTSAASWSSSRYRFGSILESQALPHGRSCRFRTESSFGMPISPYLQTVQPSFDDLVPGLMPTPEETTPEERYRFRTESTLGMPISPWAQHDQFIGSQWLQQPAWQNSPESGRQASVRSRSKSSESVSTACSVTECMNTTIMLRNLPEGLTRQSLLHMLDSEGFANRYDFAYLPANFDTLAGLTHAFVNLVSPADAQRAKAHFEGFSRWAVPSDKLCHVVWNDKQQGLSALKERYRNSPVMHDSVPDHFKPIIIIDGKRRAFPLPSQKVKAPKNFRPKC